VCAAVAASVLGARFRRRDENGGQRIHDLDLEFEDPPAAPPRLPSAVDVAWVVGANGQTLRVTLPGPWEAVAVDAGVLG